MNVKSLLREIFYYPEFALMPLNIVEGSYDSPYSMLSFNTHVIYMLVLCSLMLIQCILKCLSKRYTKVQAVHRKLNRFLFWNGLS